MLKASTIMMAALALLAGGAFAGEGMEQDGEKRFQALDADGNGYVSQYEAKDRHRIFWYYPSADANSDGHIDRSEFSAFETKVPPFEVQENK